MTKHMKSALLFAVSILFVLCSVIGVLSYGNQKVVSAEIVYEAKTVEQVAYNMVNGASIRLDEEDETSGIRFAAEMSVADYEGLKANGYKSLLFGIIIAPKEYAINHAKLTVENLFGENAKYNWPVWNGETWVNPELNIAQKTVINILPCSVRVQIMNCIIVACCQIRTVL